MLCMIYIYKEIIIIFLDEDILLCDQIPDVTTIKVNSFLLQNIYFGLKFGAINAYWLLWITICVGEGILKFECVLK